MSSDFLEKCTSTATDLCKSIHILPKVAVAALTHDTPTQTSEFQQIYQSGYLVRTGQIKFVVFNHCFISISEYGSDYESDNGIFMSYSDDLRDLTAVNDDYGEKSKSNIRLKRKTQMSSNLDDSKRSKPTQSKVKANTNARGSSWSRTG